MVNLKNNIVMEKIIKSIYSIALLTLTLFFAGCSNEDAEVSPCSNNFDNLKFVVNIDKGNTVTRAATGKKDWSVGDKIIVSIDKSSSNLCTLQYEGNGDWTVSKNNSSTSFYWNSGKLSAVHADSLVVDANSITTCGDILYTESGSYTKHDDIVEINLHMSERPVSRIAIVGMDKSFWIENLTEYTGVQSIASMKWKTNSSSGENQYKEVYGDTCVFYGILPSKNGNTEIILTNNEGATYRRSYTSKTTKAGDYIIIKGPSSSEAGKWDSHVPVNGITAKQSSVTLLLGDNGNLADLYTLSPERPTNKTVKATSSNTDVLTINSDGTYTAKSIGDAMIYFTTEDGNYSCAVNVSVKNLVDLVDFSVTSTSITISGAIYYGRQFTVTNNSDYDIYVTELDRKLDDDGLLVPAHGSKEIWNYYYVQGYTKTITLKFTCNGQQYERSGKFEV